MSASSPKLLLSGADRPKYLQSLAEENCGALIHAKVARRKNALALLQSLQQQYNAVYALDSGYTKRLSLAQYAALLTSLEQQVPKLFSWYLSFDKIGDQRVSDQYYQQLLRLCPECAQKIVWIYQCREDATRSERLQELRELEKRCNDYMQARQGKPTLIAIGGVVPILRRSVSQALCVLQEIGEVLSPFCPSIQAHILGPASREVLLYLRTQVWVASLDTSKWLVGWTGRELLLWSGEQLKASALRLPLTPQECAAVNIRVLQGWANADQDIQRQPGLWALPGLEIEDGGDLEQLTAIRRLFVRQRGRSADFSWVTPPRAEPAKRVLYLPLFQVSGREYGLISHSNRRQREPAITEEWSVVWDAAPEDRATHLFLVDGRLKTGYVTHQPGGDLCHYHFFTAVSIAKAFVQQYKETA